MAEKSTAGNHPYVSSTGAVTQIVAQLRRSFPTSMNADTLKKLAIAPNNESYVMSILRFLKIVDSEGNKIPAAAKVFSQHSDEDFQPAFAAMIAEAYSDLFSLHNDQAWTLPTNKLISYFRSNDHTSEIVGKRQAATFQVLATLAGKANAELSRSAPPKTRRSETPKPSKAVPPKQNATTQSAPKEEVNSSNAGGKANPKVSEVGLTVRVEINLPAGGDRETYDNIFKSIRENLIDAKIS